MACVVRSLPGRSQREEQLGILVFIVLLLACSRVEAAGFQIPNQSLRAVGIAGATIASTPGPEASYYNPANMNDLEDRWQGEASLTILGLPPVDYSDNRSPMLDASSQSELFFLPQLHLVSPDLGALRFGFSLTYPYGLAKNWEQPYPAATAESFSLLVVEAAPSLSYALSECFSLGASLRLVYGEGDVSSRATNPPLGAIAPLSALNRSMDGEDTGVGYHFAATLKPNRSWRFAASYRSEVDVELDGAAELSALLGQNQVASYKGGGQLDLTLPDVFSLAVSYSLAAATVEVAWSRTFWSSLEVLDFNYDRSFINTALNGFDRPLPKRWDDSDALRFGLTYDFSKQWRSTFGFAIDQTPVPQETLGFELPDSDAYMYCAGIQYTAAGGLTVGISYMYHQTTSIDVSAQSPEGATGINGRFSGGGAHAVNVGIIKRF